MEKQNCFCGITPREKSLEAVLQPLALALAVLLSGSVSAAENDPLVAELKRKLAERDAEIAALKQQLARVQTPLDTPPPIPAKSEPVAAALPVSPRNVNPVDGDDGELARALESSLVRKGGSVLRPGTMEVEPEVSYFYNEPAGNRRRDNFGLAVTGRIGLPASMQAELRLPYVVRDHWSGVGTSSGLGDVRLGLTKELLPGTDRTPSLLAFVQWRTTTGDINSNPPTGYGQHALQLGLSTVKRQDPLVLFGSVFYTANLDTAHLHNGVRYAAGNTFGGRLGTYLAATPDTSLYLGIAFNSNLADRLNGSQIDSSSRLSSVVEMGATTVIGRGRFINISAGFGVTPAAPKFSLVVSLPIRF